MLVSSTERSHSSSAGCQLHTTMSIQPYMGGDGTLVAYHAEEITPEERERRQKEAEELETKLKFINEKIPTRVFNVMGSAAGAGSGTFHDYRLARRREQERQKRLDEAYDEEQIKTEFEEHQAALQAEDEERTAKRRAQRQKKKAKKKTKGTDGTPATAGEDAGKVGQSDSEDEEHAPPVKAGGVD